MHRFTLGAVRLSTHFIAFSIFLAAVGSAQTSRGTVTGLVSDSQKAAVPAATIDLTNTATNVVRSTQSNESGLYRFDAVDPDTYTRQVMNTVFCTLAARPCS